MGLPKFNTPKYDIVLPLSKLNVSFRPFLVKEEKLLLMAAESKNPKDVVDAIRQIASNCVLEPVIFDVNNMPMVDIEYLFLQIRAKSVDENVEAQFKCNNIIEDINDKEKQCGNKMDIKIPISALKIVGIENFKKEIDITDAIKMTMKVPKFNAVNKFIQKDNSSFVSSLFDMIVSNIDTIFDGEKVLKASNFRKDELTDFVESLPSGAFEKLEEYFNTIPKIDYSIKHACSKCGFLHTINYKDITDFF